jgi:TnpA family transposase
MNSLSAERHSHECVLFGAHHQRYVLLRKGISMSFVTTQPEALHQRLASTPTSSATSYAVTEAANATTEC